MQHISKVLDGSQPSTRQPENTPGRSLGNDGRAYRPDYRCPKCRGAGFVHPLGPDGEPHYHLSIPCQCYKDSVKAYLAGHEYQAGQGARPGGQTFDNFSLTIGPGGARDAFTAVKAWAGPAADFIWLLIYGGTGNGKSHLCNAALRALLSRGVRARLVTASGFVAGLRIAMDDHKTDSLMAEYQSVPVLIIDDLGAGMKHPDEKGSEWEWSRVEELLVSRLDALLPTMCTTNLDETALPERIASRFSDQAYARSIHNAAKDYRREK